MSSAQRFAALSALCATAVASCAGTGDELQPSDAPVTAMEGAVSLCVDTAGDVSPLGRFEVDDLVDTVADLIETRVEVELTNCVLRFEVDAHFGAVTDVACGHR